MLRVALHIVLLVAPLVERASAGVVAQHKSVEAGTVGRVADTVAGVGAVGKVVDTGVGAGAVGKVVDTEVDFEVGVDFVAEAEAIPDTVPAVGVEV